MEGHYLLNLAIPNYVSNWNDNGVQLTKFMLYARDEGVLNQLVRTIQHDLESAGYINVDYYWLHLYDGRWGILGVEIPVNKFRNYFKDVEGVLVNDQYVEICHP